MMKTLNILVLIFGCILLMSCAGENNTSHPVIDLNLPSENEEVPSEPDATEEVLPSLDSEDIDSTTLTYPKIELIGNVSKRSDYSGNLILLGEVKNLGSSASFVKANCNLFDMNAALLETETTYINGTVRVIDDSEIMTNTNLDRDDIGVFKVWTNTSALDVGSFNCSFSYDTYRTRSPLANLEISGTLNQKNDGFGNLKASGFVKNSGTKGLVFGKVILAIKDESGFLLDVDGTYIDGDIVHLSSGNATDTALSSGSTGTFDARTDASFANSDRLETYLDWTDTSITGSVLGNKSINTYILSKKEQWEKRDNIINNLRKSLLD